MGKLSDHSCLDIRLSFNGAHYDDLLNTYLGSYIFTYLGDPTKTLYKI